MRKKHVLLSTAASLAVALVAASLGVATAKAEPGLSGQVTGDGGAYRYLVESIRKFPPPERFAEMIGEAGLARVDFTRMSGGVVAIHAGWKL